jgi:hypothetical protein
MNKYLKYAIVFVVFLAIGGVAGFITGQLS